MVSASSGATGNVLSLVLLQKKKKTHTSSERKEGQATWSETVADHLVFKEELKLVWGLVGEE